MALYDDYLTLRAKVASQIRSAWSFEDGDKVYFAPMETEGYRGDRFAFITPGGSFAEDYYTAGAQGTNQLTWTLDIVGSWMRDGIEFIDDFLAEKAFALRAALHPETAETGYAGVASMWIVREIDWRLGDPSDQWLRVMVKVEFVVIATRLDS